MTTVHVTPMAAIFEVQGRIAALEGRHRAVLASLEVCLSDAGIPDEQILAWLQPLHEVIPELLLMESRLAAIRRYLAAHW